MGWQLGCSRYGHHNAQNEQGEEALHGGLRCNLSALGISGRARCDEAIRLDTFCPEMITMMQEVLKQSIIKYKWW